MCSSIRTCLLSPSVMNDLRSYRDASLIDDEMRERDKDLKVVRVEKN